MPLLCGRSNTLFKVPMRAYWTLSQRFYLILQSLRSLGATHSKSTPFCGRLVQFFLLPTNVINKFLQEAHIQALSKNNNLTDLALSSDFEVNARDTLNHDFAWFARCYKRRLKATQDITSACPRLQRCSWVQMGIGRKKYCRIVTHSFIVEERMTGSNVTRVVRGIKRNWMDQDYWLRRGSIVDCKLEDLPGDIISPSWDYIDLLESFEF